MPTELDERLRTLHTHLAATAELPVEPTAARWLGEAEAVAADVVHGAAPPSAIRLRVRQVRDLLSHVDETGHPDADEHVAAAREQAAAIQDALGDHP
jgi:hypothetical protein